MFCAKYFDDWLVFEGAAEGSGRSEKVWLENNEGNIGLFKFPKTDYYSVPTYEHISEHLAAQIGRILGVPTASVDIGYRSGRIGSMSYLINRPDEMIIQGADFILAKHPEYDLNTLQDKSSGRYYCLEHLLEVSDSDAYVHFVLRMMIFDYIIGNTDRHQNNWATIIRFKDNDIGSFVVRPCPLYDNGSSLCCYVKENEIPNYLGNDNLRFESLLNNKSKSMIRLNGYEKARPTHNSVMQFLLSNYEDARLYASEFVQSLNKQVVETLIEKYPDELVSKNRKALLIKYLKAKIEQLAFFLSEGV